jgi:putative transcriptional regulator
MMSRETSKAQPSPVLPSRHPEDSLLMAYAAGTMPEATALLVATHLALCPLCRAEVGRYEAVGGAMLEEVAPTEIDASALDRVLTRLDGREPAPMRMVERHAGGIPQPLRDYLGVPFAALKWNLLLPKVREHRVACGDPGARLGLLKIKAGGAVPEHTHGGAEYTLVLAGGFADSTGQYNRGDFAYADGGLTHRPVAETDEDCICLALSEGPMRLTGRLGRLLNPFVK